jgi:hypothetical protein
MALPDTSLYSLYERYLAGESTRSNRPTGGSKTLLSDFYA